MRRIALLVLILLLFSFGFSYSSEFKSGEYVLRKKTEVAVGAKFIKVPIEGGMEIKMLDQKRFKFDINTVNTSNFAVCDVEGIAEIVAENKAIFKDQETKCVIEFLAKKNGVEVRPKGENCQYCGMGAVFDGLYVKAPAKKKVRKK